MSTEPNLDDIVAAIQAAAAVDDSRLAREIMERYGLRLCVRCTVPLKHQRDWWLCGECTHTWPWVLP